jgi:hydroxymethylpyrimidine pyrophosphatase-like HAD family hydrolase
MKSKIIAVDFDGTLCANKYPKIGAPNVTLIRHLIEQRQQGAKLIL